jgi:hypothetical protein
MIVTGPLECVTGDIPEPKQNRRVKSSKYFQLLLPLSNIVSVRFEKEKGKKEQSNRNDDV